jgi:hypothetical protein
MSPLLRRSTYMQPENITGINGYTNYINSPVKGAPSKLVITPAISLVNAN